MKFPIPPSDLEFRHTVDYGMEGRRTTAARQILFGSQALRVMQSPFKPQNGGQYPGDPPFAVQSHARGQGNSSFPDRLTAGHLPLKQGAVGRHHVRGPLHSITPAGVIAARLAYTQEAGEHNLRGRPFPNITEKSKHPRRPGHIFPYYER